MHDDSSTPSDGFLQGGRALLACVDAGPGAARVVDAAARLAALAGAPWHALLVDTRPARRRDEAGRLRALELLRRAQAQGAVTAVLEGRDPATLLAGYARRHGCATAVLARAGAHPWWRQPLARRLAQCLPGLDIVELAAAGADMPAFGTTPSTDRTAEPAGRRYPAAVGASLATALVGLPLLPLLDVANVAMLFLMMVVLVAIRLGRGPAIAATLVGFCALVLAAPRRQYDASEFKYAVALAVMLAVGWITARLTSDLREQAEAATGREARTRSLYEFARALSVALQTEQVFEITQRFLARSFDARAAILLPDDAGRLRWPADTDAQAQAIRLSVLDMAAAQWAFEHGAAAGAGTDTLPSNDHVYLPLLAPMRSRGVLAVRVPAHQAVLLPERRELLDAFAALAAIALERVHYVDVAQDAVVRMENERLRNSLLAALSHDLRTPLTGLVGLSESLTLSQPPLAAVQMELAGALRDEARRMSTLVANLLDMARIQSGGVTLKLEWQVLEETIGSALRACRWQLGARRIDTAIPRELPLVRFDATLLERVLCNLLENAAKYTPAGARIAIEAEAREQRLLVRVRDDGPGLPAGREDALFEKFVRGRQESNIAGVGLGLAICRAIVEAHGGAMRAYNDGGACFEISLPLDEAPPLPMPDSEDSH